jgi:HDOD domain
LAEAVWLNGCFQIRDARYLPFSARLSRFSLARAVAMRALTDLSHLDGSLAYRCGLFADVGASFLLWAAVEKSEGHALGPEDSLIFAREQHEAMGAQLLTGWGHDELVVRMARSHHVDAPQVPANPYWNLFVVATLIAREVTDDEDLTVSGVWPKPELVDRCAASLGMGQELRRRVLEKLRGEFASVLTVLG